jgi:hypothetical protein
LRRYFNKCPAENIYQHCYVLDPMLATGGTAIAALAMLKESGANRIKFIALIASPEGIKALTEAHPDGASPTSSLLGYGPPLGSPPIRLTARLASWRHICTGTELSARPWAHPHRE